MPRAPRVTGSDVLAALRRDGWSVVRVTGSHHHLAHSTKPGLVTVAVHPGEIVKPKTLASIVRNASLTMDEFRRLL